MTHYDFVLADALDSGDHARVAVLRTRYVYDARPERGLAPVSMAPSPCPAGRPGGTGLGPWLKGEV